MTNRARKLNDADWAPHGQYVLYWSQMNRRAASNQALLCAVELANKHNLPVLYYEGLTCSYPYASDRFHHFILRGSLETARMLEKLGIGYVFHLRRRTADPNDAFYRLAANAAAVVTDDYPVFVARTCNARAPGKISIPYYAVDASCIIPMAHFEKQEYAAYTIRPKIKRALPEVLEPVPAICVQRPFQRHPFPGTRSPGWGADPQPAARVYPSRAPSAFSSEQEIINLHTSVTEENLRDLMASCEIDHTVAPSPSCPGGRHDAEQRLGHFLEHNLRRYAKLNREPSAQATSGLSPYLHFGMISSLEVALAVREYAAEHKLIAHEFLEELIVRRELAFNFARFSPKLDSLEALPNWARATLAKHDSDRREFVYTREQFERAASHDALWNAAQMELLAYGVIHGYYRMYWGKKIIEWSETHAEALAIMIYLNDRYALDGRDPNTYTNILWCFGLHDRPWAERPIFGMIRYMSLEGMRRKTDVDAYIQQMSQPRLI